ncbi:hypothetical protein EMCRGX_G034854 [Ephydatia muelleri]
MERGGYSRMSDESAKEKAMRSIFVANIAFETTEDQLKSVLSEVGPVVNLKLIYDPATGKPRGFGFCEYQDAETAMSAVRNLSGREVSGRPLRIDSATNAPGENFRGGGGVASTQPGPMEPPIYGAQVPPEAAPEAITKAVASLPPEQMFELMKQMKWCIQHNPEETKQLLLHNPQLAYALLQAQVVMRIVDLETAQNMLHRVPRGASLQQPQPQPLREAPPGPLHGREPSVPHGREPMFPAREQPQRERERYTPPQQQQQPPMRVPPHRQGPPLATAGPGPGNYGSRGPPEAGPSMRPGFTPPQPSQSPASQPTMSPQDQEKAALIMQVLSLTEEQIRMLPPDQRNSILKLKEQIARSSGGTR